MTPRISAPGTAAEPTPRIKILIVDDHWVVRESLKQVARSLGHAVVTEEADSLGETLRLLEANADIGLLLVDLVMPGVSEFDGLRQIRALHPEVPVVIVSVHEEPDFVLEAIRHGVVGYIPKSATAAEIRLALSRVVAGEVAFPREIITRAGAAPPPARARAEGAAETRGLDALTRRESEVLLMLGRGASVSEIAAGLDISRHTVRVHLGNVMKKLDIRSREGAVRFAVENLGPLAAHVARQ